MRLALSFPDPWQVKHGPAEQRIAILPGASEPELIVTFGPLVIKPDEPRRWLDLLDEQPAELRVGRALDRTTTVGWPVRYVEVDVVDARGVVIEARVCVFYTFMEHGAAAIARAATRAVLERHGAALLSIFEAGRPDWHDVPLCLAECWDLGKRAAVRPPVETDQLRRALDLLALKRPRDAVTELDAALALDDTLEAAHYYRGIALGEQGDHAGAIAAWQRSLALAPDRVDARYNIAQAQFLLEDYAAALAGFQALDDIGAQRKVIQCLYALERYADGEVARAAFRERLAASADPRSRPIAEYVFDQFRGEGFWVHAVEPLRQEEHVQPVLMFRAMRRQPGREEAAGASVVIETSEQAKAAGTPYVIGVQTRGTFRIVDAVRDLPPYPQLKPLITRLLADALG